jgi:hypothetical protein
VDYLYPTGPGTINRFLTIDGQTNEQLIVIPAQFRSTGGPPTKGVERVYTNLQFEVYHAPNTDADFVAPSIWQVRAVRAGNGIRFEVLATDDSGQVTRVVVLYRAVGTNAWSNVEPTYDPATQTALATVAGLGTNIEYFAQAVDPSGNVALALDHGNAFTEVTFNILYLPLIRR